MTQRLVCSRNKPDVGLEQTRAAERQLNATRPETAKKNPAFAGFLRLRGKRGVLFRVFGGWRSLGSARQPLTVEEKVIEIVLQNRYLFRGARDSSGSPDLM